GKQLKTSIQNFSDARTTGQKISAGIGIGTSVIGAAAAIGSATATGSEGSRIGKGAATGAAIGSQFGPYGAAACRAIGAIVGAIRGSKSNAFKLGQEWGVTFSDGLQKQIDEDKKKLFHGDLDTAALNNLKAIIDEAGGLTAKNTDFFERKFLDV